MGAAKKTYFYNGWALNPTLLLELNGRLFFFLNGRPFTHPTPTPLLMARPSKKYFFAAFLTLPQKIHDILFSVISTILRRMTLEK